MNFQELVDTLIAKQTEFQKEALSQLAGKKVAGARARKLSLEIAALQKEFRKLSVAAAKGE